MNEKSPPKKLTRSRSDRFIGGVAAGIAQYLHIDPIFVRIAFVVSLVFGGLGVLAYVVLLAVMPIDDADEPLAPIEPRRRNLMVGVAVVVGIIALATADDGTFAAWIFGFAPGTVFGVLFWVAAAGGIAWLLASGLLSEGSDESTPPEPGPVTTPMGSEPEPAGDQPTAEAPTEPVTYAESPTQLSPTEVMETRQMAAAAEDRADEPDTQPTAARESAPSVIGRIMLWFAIGFAVLILVGILFVISAGVTAVFGGVPMAAAVILLGGGMVFAGLRGRRQLSLWLLAAAVAVTIPMAAVSVADLRIDGSYGDIKQNPLAVTDIPADGYEMAAGNMTIDLRRLDFGHRRTVDLPVESGMGLTSVIVPDDVCVSGDVHGKAGITTVRGRQTNGLDITLSSAAPEVRARFAPRQVRLDAEFKLGAFEVVDNTEWRHAGRGGSFDNEGSRQAFNARKRAAAACAPTADPKAGTAGKKVRS